MFVHVMLHMFEQNGREVKGLRKGDNMPTFDHIAGLLASQAIELPSSNSRAAGKSVATTGRPSA